MVLKAKKNAIKVNNNRPLKKETKAIQDWKICVRRSKQKLGKGEDSWGILSGAVLKEAMKCYCAMGY